MRNRPLCLPCICLLASSLYPASLRTGGTVPAINRVDCWAAEPVDFSRPAEDVPVLRCRIDNNAPAFQVEFDFGSLAAARDPAAASGVLESLTMHEAGGIRGEGLADPSGTEVLPLLEGNRFTWRAGRQSSATRGYVVEFRATWDGLEPRSAKAAEPEAGAVWAVMGAEL